MFFGLVTHQLRDPGDRPEGNSGGDPISTGTIGMIVLLSTLSMLFISSMLLFGYIRLHAPTWPPPGTPIMPPLLWLSTLVIVVSSFTMAYAQSEIRRGRQEGLRLWLGITTFLGLLFMVLQTLAWFEMGGLPNLGEASNQIRQYKFLFYFLTILHAAHLVAGVIPLVIVAQRAMRNQYTRENHAGITYFAAYWHFLDVVWLILFAVIYLDVLAPLQPLFAPLEAV